MFFPAEIAYCNTEKREVKYKESVPSKRAVEQVVTGEEGFKYKYNGKELQDELGLQWYDYGARNYDPALGRFMNLDPLAEQYDFQSPFVYANNNPVLFRDILGMGIGEDEDRKNDDYFPKNNFDDETEIPNFDDKIIDNTFSTYYVNKKTGDVIYVDDGFDDIVMVDDEYWNYIKVAERTNIYLGFMEFYRKGWTMMKLPKYFDDNHYSNLYYIPTSELVKYGEKIYNDLTIGNRFFNITSLVSIISNYIKINPILLTQIGFLQSQNVQMEKYGRRYKNIFSNILQEHYNARTYNSGILVIETGSVGVSTTGVGGVINNVIIYDTYTKKVVASFTEHYP